MKPKKKLKKMSVKKIGWSNQHGMSLEFFEPDTLQLTLSEATHLYASFRCDIDQKTIDAAFTYDEQLVLYRYHRMNYDAFIQAFRMCEDKVPVDSIHREIKSQLKKSLLYLHEKPETYLKECLGVEAPHQKLVAGGTALERDILRSLADEKRTDPYYFTYIISSRTSPFPSPEVIQKIEEKFGKLDYTSEVDKLILKALKEGITDKKHYEDLLLDYRHGHPSAGVLKRLKKEVGPFKVEAEVDRSLRHEMKMGFSKDSICSTLNEYPDKPSAAVMKALEAHYGRFSFASS